MGRPDKNDQLKNSFIIILTILTIGCTDSGTRQPIEIRHFTRLNELKETIKANLVTKVSKDSIQYSYLTDSTIAFIIRINKNDKSRLTYYNFNTLLVDKHIFTINGQVTEILKYDYDEPSMFDEEASIYFIDTYGLIAIKGIAWSYFIHFDKGGQIEKEIFKLLQQDTSGFYGYRPPPKVKVE